MYIIMYTKFIKMSIANLNTQGQRKSNHPYQIKNLQALKKIADLIGSDNVDFESQLVVDSLGVVALEVRIWDQSSGSFNPPIFYAPGTNNTVILTPPIKYVTPAVPETVLISTLRVAAGSGEETGTISAARSISLANTGTVNTEVDGQILKPGETITYDAGLNNTLSDLEYDCSLTNGELLIIFTGGSITNP